MKITKIPISLTSLTLLYMLPKTDLSQSVIRTLASSLTPPWIFPYF